MMSLALGVEVKPGRASRGRSLELHVRTMPSRVGFMFGDVGCL
jgi:hypothetical protein